MLRSWLVGVLLLMSVPSYGATLLVLGDSISAAYGMETQRGWVALLEQQLASQGDYRVINASISGETTSGGRARLPALLQRHKPDLVLIELGANDGLRGTPLKLIERNLAELIRQSQDAGADVLLLGMRIPPNYGPRYSGGFHHLYSTLAERFQIPLVPFLLEGVAGDRTLMQADGLHPNAEAQPVILSLVLKEVATLLPSSG